MNSLTDSELSEPYMQRIEGYSLMQMNDIKSALNTFQSSINTAETEDDLEAYWNIGRIYLLNENYDSTQFYLNKIVSSNKKSKYIKPARKLRSELRWQTFIQKWFGWLLN